MYARIARFEGGDTSQMDDVIAGAREMIDSNFDSPPEGLEGLKGRMDAGRPRERQGARHNPL